MVKSESKNMMAIAVTATRTAGEFLKKNYTKKNIFFYKKNGVVSASDIGAEKIILDNLSSHFPDHSFLSEEKGIIEGKKSDYLWIIDPLDGTTNFLHKLPHFCTSIALMIKGEMALGVIYQPMLDELFTAESGMGAKLNGQKIAPGTMKEIKKSVIVMGRGAEASEKLRFGKIFDRLVTQVRSIRIPGATAIDICYVACGRFDAMVNNDCNLYDCAAGNLIAKEAGTIVTDFKGNNWKPMQKTNVLVTNKYLHSKFINILKKIRNTE